MKRGLILVLILLSSYSRAEEPVVPDSASAVDQALDAPEASEASKPEEKTTEKPIEEPVVKSKPLALPMLEKPDDIDLSQYNSWLNNKYFLFPHKGTFLMPYTYNFHPHQDVYSSVTSANPSNTEEYYQRVEAEFQISFMIPVYRHIADDKWDLLFAYTHQAWWQTYNSKWSRPFRETNYMPELFVRHISSSPEKIGPLKLYGVDLGYVHQSNGQTQALSRSWDRFFSRFYFKDHGFSMIMSLWARLPESSDDDNPGILKYEGIGDFEFIKNINKHTWSIKFPFAEHPGVEIKYSYPWHDHIRWFVNYEGGYGQSLIEYNRPVDRVGMGVSLENFFDGQ